MNSATPNRFEFGEFRLDVRRRVLLDVDLKPVELPAKAFDALVYLVQNAGRVVERAELMDALWPRAVVEDNTLSQVVLRVRGAIGERCIATLKGRGYQFVEEVRIAGTTGWPDDGPTEATVNGHRRVGEPRYRLAAYVLLAFGLISFGAYWVAASRENGGRPLPAAAVGTPSSRAHEFYVSGLHYESRGKADAAVELAIQQYKRAVDEDPEFAPAWARLSSLYSEAYFFRDDATPELRMMVLDAAEKALELAPDLPEAHRAMASYLTNTGDFSGALDELAVVERAMPDDFSVPWSMGHIHMITGRLEKALASYERAVELRPDLVWLLYEPARVHQLLRDYANAERYYDRILELQPDHVPSQVAKAWLPLRRDGDVTAAQAYATQGPHRDPDLWFVPPEYFGWHAAFYERDYDAALRYLDVWTDDAWRITLADYLPKASLYGVTYELMGERERAERHFRIARTHVEAELKRNPELPELWIALGEALAWLGDSDGALDAAQNALDIVSASDDALSRSMIELGAAFRVFIRAGAFDAAFAGLDTYFSAPGVWSVQGIRPDPRLDPLRSDPRFLALVEKYGRP